jgi:hypothetical protein
MRRLEVVRQSAAILKASLPAAMLSIAAWGFAGPGLQAGNFLVSFGSIDRSAGFMVVAIVREFGTYVDADPAGIVEISGSVCLVSITRGETTRKRRCVPQRSRRSGPSMSAA